MWWRGPVKMAVLAVTLFLVCYPYPLLYIRHARRSRNPNALINPDSAALQPMLEELKPRLEGVSPGAEALEVVEKFVYEKVPYAWDWDVWGVVDYLPTVEEVAAMGREDCDGRAVVAASLLRNLGYKADLVSDGAHVWVKTDRGETMSPGRMPKVKEITDQGVRYHWGQYAVNMIRSAGYGVAVFPLSRELIVLGVFSLLAMRSGMARLGVIVCLVLMLDGLLIVRYASADPWHSPALDVANQWFGTASMVLGATILHVMQWRSRHWVIREL